MTTFRIETFGCQMNVRDSQWLECALLDRGFASNEDRNGADVVILNTCSVREKPEIRLREAVRRIGRTESRVQLIAVLGCVAQQLGGELLGASPQARLVAGADNLALVPHAIEQLLASPQEQLALLEFSAAYPERECRLCRGHSARAMVSIMQGCDNFCAYCIVPFTRGRQKFRRREDIMAECRAWLEAGALDFTLLGQNVNVWPGGFGGLLREVAALPGVRRLRFVTPHPAFMDEEVVQCFAELGNLVPRLHLPLQAGSDSILKAMGRKHDKAHYLALVRKLREARPDLALSTDLIVGFPGETEADFKETLAMVEECAFMAGYSFCYSDRPGTRAARMPGKLPQEEKLTRLDRLQRQLDGQSAQWLREQVGASREILLEAPSPRGGNDCWQGRDIYGACVNMRVEGARRDQLVEARITQAKKHSLAGEIITK